jgi:hypothetical protein
VIIGLFLLVPLAASIALGAAAVAYESPPAPKLETAAYYCPNARALQDPQEFSFDLGMEVMCLLHSDTTYYPPDPLDWRWGTLGL